MTEQQQKPKSDPYLESAKSFHLQMPLYHPYDLAIGMIKEKVYNLMTFEGTVDAYCIWCRKESVFRAHSSTRWVFEQWQNQIEGELQKFGWSCAHNNNHYYRSYYFLPEGSNEFQKIGQLPSVADFLIPQADKYRKILGDEKYKELTRGVGLSAHGIGIGAFVYLRRVFEDLIDDASAQAVANDKNFPSEKYKTARMDDKIEMVKDYLPEFLVENKSLYRILSTGIHDLSEDECLQYFETVKIGIEQILDEKIIAKEKADKAVSARAAIQKAHGKINGA